MPIGIYPRTTWHKFINSEAHKGIRHNQAMRDKISKKLKGRIRPQEETALASAGLKRHYAENPLKFAGFNNPFYGKKHSEETKAHLSAVRERLWQDPNYRLRAVKSIFKGWGKKPNKAELCLLDILDANFPSEWKYVGNGQLIIGGMCPDFTNIDGKKILIELFGDYFHKDQNPQDRIDRFNQYGYKAIVIWEHELKNKTEIIDKVRYCHDNPKR